MAPLKEKNRISSKPKFCNKMYWYGQIQHLPSIMTSDKWIEIKEAKEKEDLEAKIEKQKIKEKQQKVREEKKKSREEKKQLSTDQ